MSLASTQPDDEQLQNIVQDFENSINTIDRFKYFSLFYDGTVSWVGVSSTDAFKKNQSKAQAARKKGQKAWIDQVVRANVTFQYADTEPVGLLKNKKAYTIVASGGTQLGTELDFISDHIRHVLGFIGITDITFIDSSGVGRDESKVLTHAHEQIVSI